MLQRHHWPDGAARVMISLRYMWHSIQFQPGSTHVVKARALQRQTKYRPVLLIPHTNCKIFHLSLYPDCGDQYNQTPEIFLVKKYSRARGKAKIEGKIQLRFFKHCKTVQIVWSSEQGLAGGERSKAVRFGSCPHHAIYTKYIYPLYTSLLQEPNKERAIQNT